MLFEQALTSEQYLQKNLVPLLKRLQLSEAQIFEHLPFYFHVFQSTFPNYGKNSTADLIASAPLPGLFSRLPQKLASPPFGETLLNFSTLGIGEYRYTDMADCEVQVSFF